MMDCLGGCDGDVNIAIYIFTGRFRTGIVNTCPSIEINMVVGLDDV